MRNMKHLLSLSGHVQQRFGRARIQRQREFDHHVEAAQERRVCLLDVKRSGGRQRDGVYIQQGVRERTPLAIVEFIGVPTSVDADERRSGVGVDGPCPRAPRGADPDDCPTSHGTPNLVGGAVSRGRERLHGDMSMKLTGGVARGRTVPSPEDRRVRPTSSRVREALFSMLGSAVVDARVLDAFSGSGLLALEAWSRGAQVVAVERQARTVSALRKAATQLGATIDVRAGDVYEVLKTLPPFDGALLDPPYVDDPNIVLQRMAPHVRGWMMLEHSSKVRSPDAPAGWRCDRRRVYGASCLALFKGVA